MIHTYPISPAITATLQQHRYNVRVAPPLTHANTGTPPQVQFVTQTNLPLPDPKYLRIHAACSQVAHLSGAFQYLNDSECALEGLLVLAEDGTSSEVLEFALQRIVVPSLPRMTEYYNR